MKRFKRVFLFLISAVFVCLFIAGCNTDSTVNLNQGPPVTPTDGALILESTDNGVTWSKRFVPNFFSITKIEFLSNSSQFSAMMLLSQNGNDILDLKCTSNFGYDWTSSYHSYYQLIDVATVPGLQGGTNGGENFAICYNGLTYKSNNYGQTWSEIQLNQDAYGIDFIEKSNGDKIGLIIPSSSKDTITYYRNGSWSYKNPVDYNADEFIRDIRFIDDSTAIVCGANGFLAKTTDEGSSWEILEPPTGSSLISADYLQGIFIIGTGDGNIIRSTDKGLTWTEITTGLATANGVYAHPNSFWIFGTNSIAKSTDQGLTWTQVYSDEFDRFYDMIIANNIIYAVGGRYVY